MNQLNSFSSSYGRAEFHVCFKVKYCHRIFAVDGIKNRCHEIFLDVAKKYGIEIKEIGFDNDHVHMVVQLNPSMSISSMAKLFKGTSGHMLLKEFPYMKAKYFWGSGLWSPMIYFDSMGRDGQDPENIVNYVRNQGQ